MEEQCGLLSWSYCYQEDGIEELKQSLLYSTFELQSAVLSAHEEISRKNEEIIQLKYLIENIIKERDEFQANCHKLELEKQLFFQEMQKQEQFSKQCLESSGTSINEDQENIGECLPSDSDDNIAVQSSQEEIANTTLDVTYKIPLKKPLPETGKFLKTVMEAGPLLQTLLLAGPLPKWQHPPPKQNYIDIPPVTINSNQDSFLSEKFSNKKAIMDRDISDISPKTKYQKVVHQSSLTKYLVSP